MAARLQITVREMPHSAALEAAIRRKVASLEQVHPRITAIRATVSAPHHHHHQGNHFTVGLDITFPGGEILVNRDHAEDVYIALRDAFLAARRQLVAGARRVQGTSKLRRAAALPPLGQARSAMNSTCIIVADARVARFYGIEAVDSPRASMKLVEKASLSNAGHDLKALGTSASGRTRTETNSDRGSGPMHPMAEQRERHRFELDRRFGQEIATRAAEASRGWKEGTIVLVAKPRLLGLLREPLRKALHQRIELKELAKDFTGLAAHELQERLDSSVLLSRRGAADQP